MERGRGTGRGTKTEIAAMIEKRVLMKSTGTEKSTRVSAGKRNESRREPEAVMTKGLETRPKVEKRIGMIEKLTETGKTGRRTGTGRKKGHETGIEHGRIERERKRGKGERERKREGKGKTWEREREAGEGEGEGRGRGGRGRGRGRGRRKREGKKEREKIHEREKRRDRDRSYSSDEDVARDHERKRRRREEDHQDRDVEQSSKTNRRRDGSQDSSPRRKGDADPEVRKEKTREEDFAEEQKRLDEEMEKRRRRVQEWQELRRKKEESEKETLGVPVTHEPKSGKAWTLEGESDDEEAGPEGKLAMDVDEDGVGKPSGDDENGMSVDVENEATLQSGGDDAAGDDEIDPLDAFMNSMVLPEVEKLNSVVPPVPNDSGPELVERNGKPNLEHPKKGMNKSMGRIIPGENSDSDYGDLENDEDPLEDEDDEEFMKRVKKTKVEKLSIVDHSKIDYPPFRKNFYIEVKEISRMTPEEVASYRKQLELKIHGKDVQNLSRPGIRLDCQLRFWIL
ncbi:UNVERIFIED_CONTAM: DEAD-box ATP-dependent RNA helicase 42 [Sesamum radiatum]|uniref:DEAD-box ATP-dependent RNA helicase 42 n=1 Tax=Sesamum radiatum TaxID=300843 RepID=A0AAW2R561_SESRA